MLVCVGWKSTDLRRDRSIVSRGMVDSMWLRLRRQVAGRNGLRYLSAV